MGIVRHFGFSRPPFSAAPEADLFFPSQAAQEALATVEFALREQRAGVLVYGAPGTGKTLVARRFALAANREHDVLWIDGLRGPQAAERFAAGAGMNAAAREHVDFSRGESHPSRGAREPLVVVVDNADALQDDGWSAMATACASDNSTGGAILLALFAAPAIQDALARPALERVARRIFRAAALTDLEPDEALAYVERRLHAAGARAEDVFSAEALRAAARAARGNPGALNRVCDAALVEAFADGVAVVSVDRVRRGVAALPLAALNAGDATEAPRSAPDERRAVRQRAAAAEETPASPPRSATPELRQRLKSVVRGLRRLALEVVGGEGAAPRTLPAPAPAVRRGLPASAARLAETLNWLERTRAAPDRTSARRHERHVIHGRRVELSLADTRGESTRVEAVTRNVSRGGLAVVVGDLLYEHVPCGILIEGSAGASFRAGGRVVRCRYLPGSGRLYEAGIAFARPAAPRHTQLRVLVADNDPQGLCGVADPLSRMPGVDVRFAATPRRVLELVEQERFDAAFVASRAAGFDFARVSRAMRRRGFDRPIFALAADGLSLSEADVPGEGVRRPRHGASAAESTCVG